MLVTTGNACVVSIPCVCRVLSLGTDIPSPFDFPLPTVQYLPEEKRDEVPRLALLFVVVVVACQQSVWYSTAALCIIINWNVMLLSAQSYGSTVHYLLA
jgi:hypothetical protein